MAFIRATVSELLTLRVRLLQSLICFLAGSTIMHMSKLSPQQYWWDPLFLIMNEQMNVEHYYYINVELPLEIQLIN